MRSSVRRVAARCLAGILLLAILAPAATFAGDAPWMPLSRVMMELSQSPEFVDALLKRLGREPKAGGILGPEQVKRFREILLGKEFEALEYFPTFTVEGMGRAVRLAGEAARQGDRTASPTEAKIPAGKVALAEEPLGIPTRGSPPDPASLITKLGFGLEAGEQLDPALAPLAADGQRLADVMNRLAMNTPKGGQGDRYRVQVGAKWAETPEGLIDLLAESGHAVEVRDARYFANFGDLRYKDQDVYTPFWVDTEIVVPEAGRNLRVPVSHSQHELRVRGPLVNADLAFYMGIDGKAEFRPIYTRDQNWTLGRVARTYRGAEAREAIRLAGAIMRTFAGIQRAHPELPFGGYFALGVCNDVNAMIELHLQGSTTLYPITLDPGLFVGDGEVDRLAHRLPVDGRGNARPDVRRILGALPVSDLSQLPFPEMRHELQLVQAAWAQGHVTYARAWSPWLWLVETGLAVWRYRFWLGLSLALVLAGALFVWWGKGRGAAKA